MVIPLHDDNPATTKPYVTVGIMIACTLLYVWQHHLLSPGAAQIAAYALGVIPAVLTGQEVAPPEFAWLPARCQKPATCCTCGSSATTSRTPWAG